jgi:hypothetical protein
MQVPFYGNTEDNTHCFQAGMRMILKYFYPDEEYEWKQLEEISCKAEGKWTWPMAAYIWMAKKGLEVKSIRMFDYERFSKDPEGYLYEFFTPEVAKAQIDHADIHEEAKRAAIFAREFKGIRAVPTVEDIKRHLDEGYLVGASVNSKAMKHKEGYSGHFVVIFGYDEGGFIMHDPGLPPAPDRHVDYATFEKAWAYSGEKTKSMTAFRKKEN